MKIYIAGKITGDPNYKEKFQEYQQQLEAEGHIVLNPAVLPAGLTNAEYARIDFAMIDVADEVVFLPDWYRSPGASLERDYCDYTRKPYRVVEVDCHG